jgi:hypothetical protein
MGYPFQQRIYGKPYNKMGEKMIPTERNRGGNRTEEAIEREQSKTWNYCESILNIKED